MSVWPDYAQIVAPGYELGTDNDVERTPFDDGEIRQARIYTQARRTRRLTALIPADRLAEFREWAAAWAYRFFLWTDPDDRVARRARVVGGVAGITYRQEAQTNGPAEWRASMVLEGHE